MKRNLISTFNQLKVGRIDINFEVFITKQNAFEGNCYTDDVTRESTGTKVIFFVLLLFQGHSIKITIAFSEMCQN